MNKSNLITDPSIQMDALKSQFNIITQLMNTRQPLVITGGGVLYKIEPDSPYYDRLKALLSDIGCDIAAWIHEQNYTRISNGLHGQQSKGC